MFGFLRRLRSARYVCRLPPSRDVLIYDKTSSAELRCLFSPSTSIETAYVRSEHFNVFVLACSILTKAFWSLKFFDAYIIAYIRLVGPRLVITFIDNDCRFYRIHSRLKSSRNKPTFVAIQNGFREKEVFLSLLSKSKVHYLGRFHGSSYFWLVGLDMPEVPRSRLRRVYDDSFA